MENNNIRRAYYRKIPAYFDMNDNAIVGRNWFYDLLIQANLWFDTYIVQVEEYPVLIEETNEDESEKKDHNVPE